MLSKEASITIFGVFVMAWPRIEPRFPGPLANTLTARKHAWNLKNKYGQGDILKGKINKRTRNYDVHEKCSLQYMRIIK